MGAEEPAAAAQPIPFITLEEYLSGANLADTKSEPVFDGEHMRPEDRLKLPVTGASIPLSAIYRRVPLPAPAPPPV